MPKDREVIQCKAATQKGTRCPARRWTIEVGRGMGGRVIAESPIGNCYRHDRDNYNSAILDVDDGLRLRFMSDYDRWLALKNS